MRKLLCLILLFFCSLSYSQIVIKGKVTDKVTKEELIGANIIYEKKQIGVNSDINGDYTIEIPVNKFPIEISISYIGYTSEKIKISELEWKKNNEKNYNVSLKPDYKILKEVKIIDSRVTEKLKENSLTIESLDIIAIKETPSLNFYDGLGSLKGVDISSASLGFKIINTRGFNSTSPVRSLQIIDGVDNQAPGLNFSLGNFLGSSELDILRVEIIQGASSAYYGPNAFNGVIKMITKDPFIHNGLSIQTKFGNRNLYENNIRLCEKFQGKTGKDIFAYSLNISYMKAYDWEANNLSPVDGTNEEITNPGGYDAVNVYGDEDTDGDYNDANSSFQLKYWDYPGLGKFYRTGYLESDVVDYNTNNLKFSTGLHFKLNNELIGSYKFNYGTGTTVYQGDNRYSLKNIQLFQNILELKKENKFFIRAYKSKENSGDSYDAVFTAYRLQNYYNTSDNEEWYRKYKNNFRNNFNWDDVGWSVEGPLFDNPIVGAYYLFDGVIYPASNVYNGFTLCDSVLNANIETITSVHNNAREFADKMTGRLVPGSQEFINALEDITSKTSYLEGGTGFYDRSALSHIHAEYQFNTVNSDVKIGVNYRIYNPDTRGSIFLDTADKITNSEFGIYSGIESNLHKIINGLKLNTTIRIDKNENFNFNYSPAASIIYKPTEKDYLRLSFSSAIRNPTLSDQYLYYNAGRAILIGNLNGHGVKYGENLVTPQSLINYYLPDLVNRSKDSLNFFSVNPIKPEKTKSIEFGYRTTVFDKFYIDMNYYFSKYTDFIGYKVGVKYITIQDDTATGAYEISLPSVQAYRMAANAENVVTTMGASIGVNYYISSNFSSNANYTWNKLNENGTNDPIIPAYNTPEHKYNLGFSGKDLHFSNNFNFLRNWGFNINYKWVEGFQYEGSPQFTGIVPTYDLLDAQINKKIPSKDLNIKIGSSNLLNNLHYEVYGGPYIGRMIYLSILFELK